MRWLLLVVLLVVGGLWLPPHALVHVLEHATLTAVAEAQQDPVTVYVTRTGEKYHRDGCRYLRQSRITTTLKAALQRGFGPCSVCRPPTM